MAHCRSPAKCLKNGHFPSNQIQIVPDSNCCKLFMDNRLPARTNFSPDTSEMNHLYAFRLTLGQVVTFVAEAQRQVFSTTCSAEAVRLWINAENDSSVIELSSDVC